MLDSVHSYFKCTKKNTQLINAINKCKSLMPKTKKRRLQRHVITRFNSYSIVVESFLALFEPVLDALENLSSGDFDAKTAADAESFSDLFLKSFFNIKSLTTDLIR